MLKQKETAAGAGAVAGAGAGVEEGAKLSECLFYSQHRVAFHHHVYTSSSSVSRANALLLLPPACSSLLPHPSACSSQHALRSVIIEELLRGAATEVANAGNVTD